MAFTRYATFEQAEVLDLKGAPSQRHASLERLADFENYRTGDGYVYARIRAISSRVNRNGDGWPSIELAGFPEIFERHHSGGGFTVEAADGNPEFGFSTFVGKPIFVDHHNSNPKKARGVIVDAKLNVLDQKTSSGDDYWTSADVDREHLPPTEVELLLEVDAKSFPTLAKAIVNGDLDGFSMGCDVEKSKCSHCGHIATSPEEYCSHIVMKGAHHDYKTADGQKVSKKSYENCYGIKFFEISAVFDPADETALAREVRAAVNKEADLMPGAPPGYEGERPDPARPGQAEEVQSLAMHFEVQGMDPQTALQMAQEKVTQQHGLPGHGEGGVYAPKRWEYDPMPEMPPPRHPAPADVDADFYNTAQDALDQAYPNRPVMNNPMYSSTRTAENPLPQEMMTRAPEEIDTLRDEQLCPICFAPGTLIRAEHGLVAIEHLQVGDKVLTGSGAFKPIEKIHKTPYEGDLLHIDVGAASEPIVATPNHPFRTLLSQHTNCRPGVCDKAISFTHTHELGWAHAHHLKPGSYLVTNQLRDTQNHDTIQVPKAYRGLRNRHGSDALPLTNDVLWVIGLYLAEGSAGKREITYSLHRNELDYQNRIRKIFGELGYTSRLDLKEHKPNSAWVHVHSSTLAEWWPIWLGSGCDQKRIPGELMNLPDHRLAHLLQGIVDGDGCDNTDTLKQTSSRLASQVVEISHRLNTTKLSASISREYPEGKRVAYMVSNARGTGARHVSTPQRNIRFGHGKWEFDNRTLHRIRSIEAIPYQGSVYNLSVKDDPTYTVQNILVHNCGADMDSETCDVCGYTQPPKEFDNPDLTQAIKIREKMKETEEQDVNQPPQQPGQPGQPGEQIGDPKQQSGPLTSQMPKKAPQTAGVKSEMHWTPKVHPKTAGRINQIERPISPSNPVQTDEPKKTTVIKDQTRPVTAAMATARQLMANAQRKHGDTMNTRTADGPTPPGDTSAELRTDVTGVGGVTDASNDAASKADAQVDVTGIGSTGVTDVSADSTESLSTAGRDGDDSGFNTDKTTDDSGPTATFGDSDGSHSGVSDPVTSEPFPASEDGVKKGRVAYEDGTLEGLEQQGDPIAQGGSAVQGVQPIDSVATPSYKRVNVLEHTTTPSNNSGPTDTWSGTDGNGVLRQQEPVTNDKMEWGGVPTPDVKLHTGRVSIAAMRLAETEVELGLITPRQKWNRMVEADALPRHEVHAQLLAYSKVKTAGLNKLASQRQSGVTRLPRFQRIATGGEQTAQAPVSDTDLDAGLFLR